jgi:RNA polymerase sigma factor (sigma-70 family)
MIAAVPASHSNMDPLAELATSARTGDRVAAEKLCRALEGPIYRLALRVLGHPEDARDAAQEILLQILTHLSQYRGDSKLLTWAYTAATRHLLRRRSQRERRRRVEDVAGLIDRGLGVTEPASAPTGDVKVAERETQLACTQAILYALGREERVAIVLAEMLGADDATGAALCEISVAAYRKRLSRARRILRPLLEERCGIVDPAKPCRCRRQARAKQLAGPVALRWAHLPVVDAQRIDTAYEQLGALRRLGSVFAIEPPIAPPAELWNQIRNSLPGLFDA